MGKSCKVNKCYDVYKTKPCVSKLPFVTFLEKEEITYFEISSSSKIMLLMLRCYMLNNSYHLLVTSYEMSR